MIRMIKDGTCTMDDTIATLLVPNRATTLTELRALIAEKMQIADWYERGLVLVLVLVLVYVSISVLVLVLYSFRFWGWVSILVLFCF
jgi:hypothetical protein